MPKQVYPFDDYSFNLLKIELAQKIGFSVNTTAECVKLSELIFNAGLPLVSESTLYRVFAQNRNHKPYKNTLSILSQYLGFGSWDDFYKASTKKKIFNYQNGIITTPSIENNLVFQCIETEAFSALDNFLVKITEAELDAQETIALTIFDSLRGSSKTIPFFKRFSSTPFIRKQFFENCFDPSFRIPNYDLGFKYYLKNVNPYSGSSDLQDFIFAKTVLFRHYFMHNKHDKAFSIGNEIYHDMNLNQKDLESIYIFPRIRFMAYKLWYLKLIDVRHSLLEDYSSYLLYYCDEIYHKLDAIEKKILFYCVGEAFLGTETGPKYQSKLKHLFYKEYTDFPKYLFKKSIKEALPYFEPNGLLYRRPLMQNGIS
jgi:hypothetical protein